MFDWLKRLCGFHVCEWTEWETMDLPIWAVTIGGEPFPVSQKQIGVRYVDVRFCACGKYEVKKASQP